MDTMASFPGKLLEIMYLQMLVLLCSFCLKWYEARRSVKQPSSLGCTLIFLSVILAVFVVPELVIYLWHYPALLLEVSFILPSAVIVGTCFLVIAITGVWRLTRRDKSGASKRSS